MGNHFDLRSSTGFLGVSELCNFLQQILRVPPVGGSGPPLLPVLATNCTRFVALQIAGIITAPTLCLTFGIAGLPPHS